MDVRTIGPEPDPGVVETIEAPSQAGGPGEESENNSQGRVVEGEYPKRPAHVEVPESVRQFLGIVENSRDEEPGEHEEEIDPTPTGGGQPEEETAREVWPRHAQSEVIDQHEKDRQATHSIKNAEMTPLPDAGRRSNMGSVNGERGPGCKRRLVGSHAALPGPG